MHESLKAFPEILVEKHDGILILLRIKPHFKFLTNNLLYHSAFKH